MFVIGKNQNVREFHTSPARKDGAKSFGESRQALTQKSKLVDRNSFRVKINFDPLRYAAGNLGKLDDPKKEI